MCWFVAGCYVSSIQNRQTCPINVKNFSSRNRVTTSARATIDVAEGISHMQPIWNDPKRANAVKGLSILHVNLERELNLPGRLDGIKQYFMAFPFKSHRALHVVNFSPRTIDFYDSTE